MNIELPAILGIPILLILVVIFVRLWDNFAYALGRLLGISRIVNWLFAKFFPETVEKKEFHNERP